MRRLVALLALGACTAAGAQQIQFGEAKPAAKTHVVLLTDAVEVASGREQVVELRFRVEPGFHINSHTPKDELLIPTVLMIRGGVQVKAETYPAGTPFRLPLGGETLDVYQGEFRVGVRLVAGPGESTMTGTLRYQACDNAACFPAKVLPVAVAVTAR